MGENVGNGNEMKMMFDDEDFGESKQQLQKIDPRKARFPHCIVWTPLPVISWLIPFVGHVGICREDGVILDFAGPNFVCVDNFTFGAVARYIQINKDKDCSMSLLPTVFNNGDQYEDEPGTDALAWDDAIRKGTQEFQHHSYSLFTCNCHSFVANNLNRLGFHSGGWNVVNLAALIFLKGRWVSTGAMVRSYLPFVVVCGFGLLFGGMTFLTFFGLLYFPSCWLVSSWYLLFQGFDPVVDFILFFFVI